VLLLVALSTVSILTLPFAARWYDMQSLDDAIRHPPSLSPVLSPTAFAQRPHAHGEGQRETTPPFVERFAYRFTSLLGHDDLGRSLLFRLLPAVLISAAIGLAAAAIAVVVGVSWGALSALAGGRIDLVMMRIVDVFYGLPYILMVILLKMGLTPSLTALFPDHDRAANVLVLFVAIGGVSWLTMARVVRGQVLSLKEAPFVEAARVSGASTLRILVVHIVPNLIGTVLTYALLVVPQAILQEAFLSFLGIGIQQPTPSLGRLAADGVEAVNMFVGYWWLLIFPCGVLVITLLALNIVGDALRDWYDPKSAAVASP
jgi:oligopeptide transport system permease protein